MFKKNHEIQNQLATYRFKEKKLCLKLFDNSKKEILFNFPIRQVVEFENKILIRLEPDIGKILNENVCCYSCEGVLLWQIQPTKTIDADCPYTNIIVKNEKLFLHNWSGEKIQVNPKNGVILKKEFTKYREFDERY